MKKTATKLYFVYDEETASRGYDGCRGSCYQQILIPHGVCRTKPINRMYREFSVATSDRLKLSCHIFLVVLRFTAECNRETVHGNFKILAATWAAFEARIIAKHFTAAYNNHELQHKDRARWLRELQKVGEYADTICGVTTESFNALADLNSGDFERIELYSTVIPFPIDEDELVIVDF